MICFKEWVKDFGDPESHLSRIPKTFEILEPEAVLNGYEDGPIDAEDAESE